MWNEPTYAALINYDIVSEPAPIIVSEEEMLFIYETEEIIDSLRIAGN